ncbi:MAG: mechanosensitive ion channel family protein [Spirochaetaceae bacterium]|jgi:small-conductance mechanosensitive channel|nr:mechanosensitive ion channel family protein [Spirochaetaceae bacterium]
MEEEIKVVESAAGDAERAAEDLIGFAQNLGKAAAFAVAGILLIILLWKLSRRLTDRIVKPRSRTNKAPVVRKFKILSAKQLGAFFCGIITVIKVLLTILLSYITVAIVLSMFPVTEDLAGNLFSYIWNPLKNIGLSFARYFPNLITIAIILTLTHYIIKGLKFLAIQVEKEKIVLPHFYADWARPTFNIIRALLYVFNIAIIYPYLPGSDSPIFRGVSIFAGIIVSLGSSGAIGNLVAGIMMTYMRPFKIGDMVQIQGVTGIIVEKTLTAVRIKTHFNEYVTYPNTNVLGGSIINYQTSTDEDEEGLILHAEITFGYDTPWQTVHRLLIDAALKTDYVLKTPKPFVLQTALDDNYCRYQINLYTKEIGRMPFIYAKLYENIQDCFKAEGLDLTAPGYLVNIDAGCRGG